MYFCVSVCADSWNMLNLFYTCIFATPDLPYQDCRISSSVRVRSTSTRSMWTPNPNVSKALSQHALLLMKAWAQPLNIYLLLLLLGQATVNVSRQRPADARHENHACRNPQQEAACHWAKVIPCDKSWLQEVMGGGGMFSGGGWAHILVDLFFRKNNTALKSDNACLTYWTSHLALNPH